MADKEKDEAAKTPAIKYRAQGFYMKDFSFENPKAPQIFSNAAEKPKMELSVDVAVQKVEGSSFEVTLKTNAQASVNGEVIFLVELAYAGLFVVHPDLKKDEAERILLVECAKDVFPFSRRIISDATREGGFAPLILDPVDFEAVYISRKQ